MAEQTKAELEAENARLQAENENLRGQLAAAGAARGVQAPVQHTFVLSEGQRQELAMHGNVLIDGRYRTADEVDAMLGSDQSAVPLEVPDQVRQLPKEATRSAVAGVDFIYPSVAPGQLDPAVAGQPGVHGPAADTAKS
jgi:hypothetical protein